MRRTMILTRAWHVTVSLYSSKKSIVPAGIIKMSSGLFYFSAFVYFSEVQNCPGVSDVSHGQIVFISISHCLKALLFIVVRSARKKPDRVGAHILDIRTF